MLRITDVAIIGAGPYGLSLAAHLKSKGVPFRIFGKPLSTWRNHMPQGMCLKSEGFASNLSAPAPDSTLKAYCAKHGLSYADQHRPVELDTFLAYSGDFQKRFVPELEEKNVISVAKKGERFQLTLEDGEIVDALRVVLAVGITSFAHMPVELAALPAWAASHSFDNHDMSKFKGKDVVVIGAGSSAIDTAASLRDAGANVRVVARSSFIDYHAPPDANEAKFISQIQRPTSGIGPGWNSFLYTKFPHLFRLLPQAKRLAIVKRHLGPAPGWFMRERIEGKIPMIFNTKLTSAETINGRVALHLIDHKGNGSTVIADHIIAATGYKPSLQRLKFLGANLRVRISSVVDTPNLSENFETSLKNFFVIGPLSANAFGPLMRFMVGSEYAAPRLAQHLARTIIFSGTETRAA